MGNMSEQYRLVPYSNVEAVALMDFFVRLSKGNTVRAQDLMLGIGRKSDVAIVKNADRVVAFRHCYPTSRRSIHFHQAAVLREHRRQGIFTELLANVLEVAGRKEVTADISRDAHHLHTMLNMGFTIDHAISASQVRIIRPSRRLFG